MAQLLTSPHSRKQGDVDALGTLRLLDAIRTCGLTNHVRFYQVRAPPRSPAQRLDLIAFPSLGFHL
jgi:hypothetical protein